MLPDKPDQTGSMPSTAPRSLPGISLNQARHAALAAQGFGLRRADAPSRWPAMAKALDHIGLLQIDSVSALIRSHYLPLYSRLGAYSRAELDARTLAGKRRAYFEYWGHEASFLPMDWYRLFRWRMDSARQGRDIYGGLYRFAQENPQAVRDVLDRLRLDGPSPARALAPQEKKSGPWWGWTGTKQAMEYLFWTGEVTATRHGAFERTYGLPEQMLPANVLDAPVPEPEEARRLLMLESVKALGIATEPDLRDYFRLGPDESRRALAALAEAGVVEEVAVDGWKHSAWRLAGAGPGDYAALAPTALLSPFDSLVFNRDRTERLFGFRYRLEFYVPPEKRQFGYYVMPFLYRGHLVGRVDVRARRADSRLLVPAIHWEGTPGPAVHKALVAEVERLASWLDLTEIEWPAGYR